MKTEKKKFLTILISPSGGGKSTILKRIISQRDDLQYSISYTTRDRREGEIHGKHYYFISEEEFKKKIKENEFIEYAIVHDCYYGTSKKAIERSYKNDKYVIMDVDVQGAEKILKSNIEAVTVFILPPTFSNLKNRLKNRETETQEQLQVRLDNAKKEVEKYNLFHYLVVNDDLDKAVSEINEIIDSEKLKANRYTDIKEKFFDN